MNPKTHDLDDYRRANGAVSLFQSGLIGLIATHNTGLNATAKTIGNPETGDPDDIFARGSRRAAEELLIRAYRHAGLDEKNIKRDFSSENRRLVLEFFISRGVDPQNPHLRDMFTGIDRMNQDITYGKVGGEVKGVSLTHQVFTQFPWILKPADVSPAKEPNTPREAEAQETPTAVARRPSPSSTKQPFQNANTPITVEMGFPEYLRLVRAEGNAASFTPRMQAYEREFSEALMKNMRAQNIAIDTMDIRGLCQKILKGEDLDLNPQLAKAIQDTVHQTMTFTLRRDALAAEKPADLDGQPPRGTTLALVHNALQTARLTN